MSGGPFTSRLVWGSPEWLLPAVALVAVVGLLALRDYLRAPSVDRIRWLALALKLAVVISLGMFLCDPQWETVRPVPGANEFWMMADNSESLGLRSTDGTMSRGEQWVEALSADPAWLSQLENDFQVRRFLFDDRLHPVADFASMDFQGTSSQLHSALEQLAQRVRHRPCTGILLFTDGNATDSPLDASLLKQLPPVYCVVPQIPNDLRDVAVGQIQVTQSNFETAPITVQTELTTLGSWPGPLTVQLVDETGRELQRQEWKPPLQGPGNPIRFRFRPEGSGVQGFRVRAFAQADSVDFDQQRTDMEVTLENNQRWCVVDRGGGPFRVLYVSGRSNWEYKFLRRALEPDDEVHLVGLIRIARREPRFTFRGRTGESTNPLYRGFEHPEQEEAERYDQPVLLRLETRDADELKGGFPVEAAELFQYHAMVLDDIEAAYFTTDQHQLVRDFVTRRGGALWMLGGPDTFREGGYQDTPIGTIVPIYLEPSTVDHPETMADVPFRFALTREGWLEPWMRQRESVAEEGERLAALPVLFNPSFIGEARPGASALAELKTADGTTVPMLISQRYGAGKTIALTTADLWRWQLQADETQAGQLDQFWRQVIRWSVSDVTPRLAAEVEPRNGRLSIRLHVLDPEFMAAADADVELRVTGPDGAQFTLTAQPSTETLGTYELELTPAQSGFYRATAVARFAEQQPPLERQIGWTWDPRRAELEHLAISRRNLAAIADSTGGALLELRDLAAAMERVRVTERSVVEPVRDRLWHRWWWLALVLVSLVGEWGLRRWHGLA